MKKVDLIVTAPHIYTMKGEGVGYEEKKALVVDGSKIIDIVDIDKLSDQYEAEEQLDMSHHILLPGFIDAHMHTSCNIMRGLAQDTNNWMMYGLQPFDNAATQAEKDIGCPVALIEAAKAGTTTMGDYEANMDASCNFIAKLGTRGNVTLMICSAKRKVYKPGELYEFDDTMGEASLNANIALYDKWHGYDGGRMKVLFGPQGADFVSPELLLKIQKIAKERHTKIHMHTQQGDRETYQIEQRYGKRPTQFLQDLNFLDSTLIAVHLTDCTDEEAQIIARSGAGMIVCPGSIGIIDGIVPPSTAFQEAGGKVALGSDQAPGNNCHNIISEMKSVALFNKIKYTNPEVLPAWRALRMATIEGAQALGLDDTIGSLEVGKCADFIAIDYMHPSMLPIYTYPMRNMVPNIVYSARGEEVVLSVVNGKIVMKDRKLVNVDEMEYMSKMNDCPDDIGKRAADEFFAINGTNAQFMREEKL